MTDKFLYYVKPVHNIIHRVTVFLENYISWYPFSVLFVNHFQTLLLYTYRGLGVEWGRRLCLRCISFQNGIIFMSYFNTYLHIVEPHFIRKDSFKTFRYFRNFCVNHLYCWIFILVIVYVFCFLTFVSITYFYNKRLKYLSSMLSYSF